MKACYSRAIRRVGAVHFSRGLWRSGPGLSTRRLVFCLLLLSWADPGSAALRWHWDDKFNEGEKRQLTSWLAQTHEALERYAGPLPFDVHLHLRRSRRGTGPVPWANTRRMGRQELFFYVNMQRPGEDFLADWTAPHEFSHLLLPYLGRRNAWFAEGFASYLQHSVMVELGVIDQPEALRRRDRKMLAAVRRLRKVEQPLPDSVPELRARRAYPTFYWGGAVYFERVDAALKGQGSSLRAVLRDYLRCCRLQPVDSLDDLVARLDALVAAPLFREELARMRSTPGVPPRP